MIGVPYFYQRVDDIVRSKVEQQLNGLLAPLEVEVRSAELVEGRGIQLRDVVIHDPTLLGDQAQVATFREIFIGCSANWEELIEGAPDVCLIEVREPTLRLTRTADGVWHGLELFQLDLDPDDSLIERKLTAPIVIYNGSVEIIDELCETVVSSRIPGNFPLTSFAEMFRAENRPTPFVRSQIHPMIGTMAFDPDASDPASRSIAPQSPFDQTPISSQPPITGPLVNPLDVNRPDAIVPNVAGPLDAPLGGPIGSGDISGANAANNSIATSPSLTIIQGVPVRLDGIEIRIESPQQTEDGREFRSFSGGVSSHYFQRLEFNGSVDPENSAWVINGALERLSVTPDLMSRLPDPLTEKLNDYGPISAQVDMSFGAGSDPESPLGFRFEVSGIVSQGRVEFPQLERPLTELGATFYVTDQLFDIRDLQATSGDTRLNLTCTGTDYLTGGPMTVSVGIFDLNLTRHLESLMPDSAQSLWWQFEPTGRINATAQLHRNSGRWAVEQAEVNCIDVSYSYYKSPFPLNQSTGTITLDHNQLLTVDLQAYSGSQRIDIDGQLVNATSSPYGYVDITAKELTIDEKLLKSLSPRAQLVIRSLAPTGTIGVTAHIERPAYGAPIRKHAQLDLQHIAIRYDKFRYPVTNITGQIEINDDDWTFTNLRGVNDTAQIQCRGTLAPAPGGKLLDLYFSAQQLQLEDELRDAFPANVSQLWKDLSLVGRVNANANVRYLSGPMPSKPEVTFTADLMPAFCRMQSNWFPYPIEELEGHVIYEDGKFQVDDFRASHGEVRLAAAVKCDFRPDTSWRLAFDGMTIEQIEIDGDFLEAAPDALAAAIVPLQLQGPMNLNGAISFAKPPGVTSPIMTQWDLAIALHQTDARLVVDVQSVNGSVTLRGVRSEQGVRCWGFLDIDSMVYDDIQMTDIRGPFFLDDQHVLLGADVPSDSAAGRIVTGETSPAGAAQSINGRIFDGHLFCDGQVALDEQRKYILRLRLNQADLATAAREMMPGDQRLQGKVYGVANVTGRGSNLNFLHAVGSVHLRQADIYELPEMIKVLQTLSIREPDRTAFSDVDIDFTVKDRYAQFSRLNFTGNALSLNGSGGMDFNQNVKATFGTRLGRRNSLPLIGNLLGDVGDQLVMVKVDGKLNALNVTRQVLPGMSDTFEQLQNGLQPPPAGTPLRQMPGSPLFPSAGSSHPGAPPRSTFDRPRY